MDDLTIGNLQGAAFDAEAMHALARRGSSPVQPQGLAALDLNRSGKDMDLDQAAQELQGLLFSQMLKAMREAVPESEFLPKGTGEKTFESFLDEEYVKHLTQEMGETELTQAIKEQLERMMGASMDRKNTD